MAGKVAKAPEPLSREDRIKATHAAVQKKLTALTKALPKKLKISKDACEALTTRLLEAQLVFDYHLPVNTGDKLANGQELLALADHHLLGKEAVEDILAFFASANANDILAHTAPYKRATYLEGLSLDMAEDMAYLQATSYRYAPTLKLAAELLAKEAGGAFAKAWRPKASASIVSKLYFRRGQVPSGWLTDVMQGRINCGSSDAVQGAAEFFRGIMQHQALAVQDAGRDPLPDQPTSTDIVQWDVTELCHPSSGARVDQLATYLPKLSAEDAGVRAEATSIGQEHITVYRVKECSCCSELDLEPGSVMLVNLMLAVPCKRHFGFAARLPEQLLACTMELQIGTPSAFSRMKKGLDAHDRALLGARIPLIAKLQELAGGSEGKLSMPPPKGKAPPANARVGDAQQGKRMLDAFSAIDVMRPETQDREAKALVAPAPGVDALAVHERDRAPPGSRWVTLWQSDAPLFRIDGVSLRASGKVSPLCKSTLLLSGVCEDGTVDHLAEEQLIKVPTTRSELHFIADGHSPKGQCIGNLSEYSKVILEQFEPTRSQQWVELGDVTIKAVAQVPPLTMDDSAMQMEDEVDVGKVAESAVEVEAGAAKQ